MNAFGSPDAFHVGSMVAVLEVGAFSTLIHSKLMSFYRVHLRLQ